MTLDRLRAPSSGRSATASCSTCWGSWPASSARRRTRVRVAAPSSAAIRARCPPVMQPVVGQLVEPDARCARSRPAARRRRGLGRGTHRSGLVDWLRSRSPTRTAGDMLIVGAVEDRGEHGAPGRGVGRPVPRRVRGSSWRCQLDWTGSTPTARRRRVWRSRSDGSDGSRTWPSDRSGGAGTARSCRRTSRSHAALDPDGRTSGGGAPRGTRTARLAVVDGRLASTTPVAAPAELRIELLK